MYEFSHKYQNCKIENRKCGLLWKKVIKQAMEDAATNKPIGENKNCYNLVNAQAKNWFQSNNKDFTQVCHMANLRPQGVRKKFINYINKKGRKK